DVDEGRGVVADLPRREGCSLTGLAGRPLEEGRTEETDDAVADHLVEDGVLLPEQGDDVAAPDLDELGDLRGLSEVLLGDARETADVTEHRGDHGFARREVAGAVVAVGEHPLHGALGESRRERAPLFRVVDEPPLEEVEEALDEVAVARAELAAPS